LGTAASDEAKTKSTTLQAGLTIAQNGNTINAGQASVRQAQQTLTTDRVNLTRDAQLVKQGYLAQQAYDQQATLVANDAQAVRSAQVTLQNTVSQVQTNGTTSSGLQGATVAAAKADEQTALGAANQLRVQIAKAAITSPIDGVVVNRNLNPGEYPGTRQIFTLQQTDKVYAVLNGSGGQIVGVATGSPVHIISSDRATLSGTAAVSAVLDQLTPGSTNFVIKAVLPNPGDLFHSGMVITGQVSRPKTTGMRIPLTSFTDDTQTTVQTIVNSAIRTLPVTLVAEDGKFAVVEGLHYGQAIVINGQLGLSDGQPAEPVTGKNRTVAER
jgi:RND family efflux transporter MFP subunit